MSGTERSQTSTRWCQILGHKDEDVLKMSNNGLYKRCEWCGREKQVPKFSSEDKNATIIQRMVSPLVRYLHTDT